jgi:uncharacterized protein DUF4908
VHASKTPHSRGISRGMFGWEIVRGALVMTIMAMALGVAASPCAAGPLSLRGILFPDLKTRDRPEMPPLGTFRTEDGVRFIFDRSTGVTLLRFDRSAEVWVLSTTRGPRGDVLYRNDAGDLFMKVTNVGGATMYYGARPGGEPVAFVGPASTIRLQALNAQALLRSLAQASVRASRAAGQLIVFDAPDVTSGSEAIYADAAAVAAEAVMAISQRKNGRKAAQKITRIQLVQGGKVGAHMAGASLVVSIDPRKGLAGRPSSRKMITAATH